MPRRTWCRRAGARLIVAREQVRPVLVGRRRHPSADADQAPRPRVSLAKRRRTRPATIPPTPISPMRKVSRPGLSRRQRDRPAPAYYASGIIMPQSSSGVRALAAPKRFAEPQEIANSGTSWQCRNPSVANPKRLRRSLAEASPGSATLPAGNTRHVRTPQSALTRPHYRLT